MIKLLEIRFGRPKVFEFGSVEEAMKSALNSIKENLALPIGVYDEEEKAIYLIHDSLVERNIAIGEMKKQFGIENDFKTFHYKIWSKI